MCEMVRSFRSLFIISNMLGISWAIGNVKIYKKAYVNMYFVNIKRPQRSRIDLLSHKVIQVCDYFFFVK